MFEGNNSKIKNVSVFENLLVHLDVVYYNNVTQETIKICSVENDEVFINFEDNSNIDSIVSEETVNRNIKTTITYKVVLNISLDLKGISLVDTV